jgi:hypothetical protein
MEGNLPRATEAKKLSKKHMPIPHEPSTLTSYEPTIVAHAGPIEPIYVETAEPKKSSKQKGKGRKRF